MHIERQVALSASRRACTLFMSTRMSVDTPNWSAFEVCIHNLCLIERIGPVAKLIHMLGFCRSINVLFCQISVILHNNSVIYFRVQAFKTNF